MKATYLLYLLFSCICLNVTSQTVFHQDVFHGGVTAGGFSTEQGSGSGTISLYMESGSTIRKAYLLSYRAGYPPNTPITLNGLPFIFDTTNILMSVSHINTSFTPINLYYTDITTYLSNNLTTTFNITIPNHNNLPIGWGWFTAFIYVEYNNSILPKTATSLWINDKDFTGDQMYNYNNLLPINKSNPVSLSLYSDRTADTIFGEGYDSYVNSNLLGTVGGSDALNSSWNGAGVKGHFYYQNNSLFGLDDDTPDNLMRGSDALADIKDYVSNNDTALDFRLTHQMYPSNAPSRTNVNLTQIITYSSPCDTFTTTLTPDTTICHGKTLQLQATGGVSTGSNTGYEWSAISDSAAIDDLSCTDCPNPVFSGDSSQVYTVRIWNTDSCSVVKPVRIGVSHPQELNTKMFRSICSFSTGKILVEDLPDIVVQLGAVNPNGDTISPNSSNDFTGLSAGDYTVFYIDKFGCSNDTLIYVEPVISTVAQFNAYPKSGTAPIQINLTNQSQNATDYSWWLNGEYQGNSFSGFYTDTSGVYDIELIAWKTDSICADTASFTVLVFDSLVAALPNVFTPNNDGTNDFFNVKVNLPVSYKLSILNRWGNVVFENKGELIEGTHKLWNGTVKNGDLVTDGTYFYTISFVLDRETVDCEITECEVSKEGFVQVFGR